MSTRPSALHFLLLVLLVFSLAACGSSGGGNMSGTLNVSLSSSMALAPQDGTPAAISVTVTGATSAATLSASGVPANLIATFTQPNASGSGAVTFAASANVPAGSYSVKVIATTSSGTASQPLTVVVAVATVVESSTDAQLGINGKLQQFMSTSFQPADWDYKFFTDHPAPLEPAQLNFLGSQHIRIQALAVPWIADTGQASDWNFGELDAVVQPVLSVTDHSPEFQIAVTPSFFSLPSPLTSGDANLQLFVSYCQNLVRYYNKGGFMWAGKNFQSPNPQYPITWWGIFNEYNINGLTAEDYVVLYNAVVPAMLAVDPTIKMSAIELSDYDYTVGKPSNNLPQFVAAANAGGVNAQVNVASTHFYSTCNQQTLDTAIFASIPSFVSDVQYFRQEFALRPDLGNVAVWVTENNVNADYEGANGMSACNPGQKYVTDMRAVSQFFAAWRPYVFSQLGKAGSQALYHWDYDADAEFAEADYTTDNKYLSYWVDYTLGKLFPVTAATAPSILNLSTTETVTVECLATQNPDGSYLVMVTDRAVQNATDNNGPGSPRTVIVDLSALGNMATVSQITLDVNTNVTNGPTSVSLTPAAKLSVTLNGYGTAFLVLKP